MSAPALLRNLLVAVACSNVLYVPLRATESSVPREGLLVLTNGRVIEGIIGVDGEHFHVLLPKGRLQVRGDQVEFLCQSKEEAYIRRRARRITTTATADAHLEMARWCIQNELLASAKIEVAAARKLDPQHRLLSSVERQLVQARELLARTAEAAPVVEDANILTASAEVASTGQAFGEIPPWARTEFIKRIQPMMAQSCATSGCHLPQTSRELQIDRLALDGVGNPDLIHRNLASTISMLNLAQPDESRLLTMGATAHGRPRKQSRPLSPHQLEILRAWVTQLALNEPPQEDIEEAPVTQIVVGMNSGPLQKSLSVAEPAATPDPFDPAEFNQSQDGTNEPQAAEAKEPVEAPQTESPQ